MNVCMGGGRGEIYYVCMSLCAFFFWGGGVCECEHCVSCVRYFSMDECISVVI